MECWQCRADPPPWHQGRAALRYDEQARRIILPLKYGDRVESARALAHHMARSGATLLREAELLVPVPLYWRRRLARRYNQAALLAWSLGRIAGCAVLPDALRRVRQTDSLAGKTRLERQATVSDAFTTRPGRTAQVAGRRVVLVDDVLTTGSTAGACTRVLLAAGAARVDLLVGARVEYSAPDEALP